MKKQDGMRRFYIQHVFTLQSSAGFLCCLILRRLFEFTSSKQFIINKLNTEAKAVALPHPVIRNGYSDDDLKKISGYNVIEVLNHSCNSEHKWDVALSAGKAVWIIGDDDTHDVLDKKQTFTNWTMIDCHQHNKDSLSNNLINGNAYAVTGNNSLLR